MITCKFYGGRLAEVMQTVASLFHIVYIKKLNIDDVILPIEYKGTDFSKIDNYSVFIDNYPIFSKLKKCFQRNINISEFRECNISKNWGQLYLKDPMTDNVIVSNHWVDFIYNSNIYKNLYKSESLWNIVKSKYESLYKNNTLAIHVRRGDFCIIDSDREKYKDHKERKILKIDRIQNSINNASIYTNIMIFSDDIKWCKDNITKKDNVYFIEGNKPYQDMILISLCDDVMRTPGSTFSKMALSLH